MSSQGSGAGSFWMGAPPPQPARRRGASAGPSPRLKPAKDPSFDPGLQFSMDGMDDAPDASAADAMPVKMQVSGASSEGDRAPVRSRSSGSQRRSIPDGSAASPRERAEKKARRSTGSKSGSGTPSLSASPSMSSALAPMAVPAFALEADLQPTTQRLEDFQLGRRVFHVHFGHGYVASLEAEPTPPQPGQPPEPPKKERVLTARTHNINVVFDNPQHKQARARAQFVGAQFCGAQFFGAQFSDAHPTHTRCACAPSTPCRRWW